MVYHAAGDCRSVSGANTGGLRNQLDQRGDSFHDRTCYAFFFTGSDPSVLDLLSDSMESRKKALTERSLTRRGRFSWEAEKYKIRKRGFHGKDFMI